VDRLQHPREEVTVVLPFPSVLNSWRGASRRTQESATMSRRVKMERGSGNLFTNLDWCRRDDTPSLRFA
jgi:hypothetical protein